MTLLSVGPCGTLEEIRMKYETEKKERLLAEQALVIQKKNVQLRYWILGGAALLAISVGGGIQYRNTQRRKLLLITKEHENAILKAMVSGEELERNRISRELHDGVASTLGAVRMSLEAIPFLSAGLQPAQLKKVTDIVGRTHTDIRRIAHNLLPLTLEKEGFLNALVQLISDIQDMGLLQISMHHQLPDNFRPGPGIELMLHRIVQELINNITRHAQATKARIEIKLEGSELQVRICDDGIGMHQASEHQGLSSIRQRLQALGGSFDIKAAPLKGSIAQLSLRINQVSQ